MEKKLEQIGFIVRTRQQETLAEAIQIRYPNIPKPYLTFLNSLEYGAAKDETTWFNTIGDFNGTKKSEFLWNEFEIMILEALEEDDEDTIEETNAIIQFWDMHIPFLLSCKNQYCYFAICLNDENYGQIVYGNEPEFEVTEFIATDFMDFMNKLTSKTLDEKFLNEIV
jgi:hypothetical protein